MATLSKAQQYVLDRMREGWTLKRSYTAPWYWLLRGNLAESVRTATIDALIKRGYILRSAGSGGYWGVYELTQDAPK